MRKITKTYKVGDRVTCPNCDDVPGTVIKVGYNGFTLVQYDDGVIGCATADELAEVSNA